MGIFATEIETEATQRIQRAKSSNSESLDLSRCDLTSLPEAIAELTNLASLDLCHNQLTSLPEAIAQLKNLTSLNLNNNPVTSLPEAIFQLQNLQSLNLSHNQLTFLPEAIAKLKSLTTLDLNWNQLKSLPEAITQLKNLTELYLLDNQLKSLPETITQLKNLRVLILGGNRLTSWPKEIVGLENLENLELVDNQLTSLPKVITEFKNLRMLILSGNRLTSLPKALAKLENLEKLELFDNQIASLPKAITKLKNLRELYLNNNQLKSLPETIAELKNLEELNLTGNQLTSLPETIAELKNLTSLDLSQNQLTSLPEGITKLKNLKELYLHGNDGLSIPAEVLEPACHNVIFSKKKANNPEKILDYYFRIQGGQKRPLNEAKLILVGFGGVGKTSLVNRLVENTFDKDSPQTEGIQITQWPIQLNNTESVRLNIWDFGDHEIMHATHQFFLTHRSLYIVVINRRQGHEDADAEYWLNLIGSFGKDSPVIIVLNKINACPFDLNRRALRQKFPNIVEFLETDCANAHNLDQLRQLIKQQTDRLDDLRDAFPAKWFGIKDQLGKISENYMSFERYRQFCSDQGETDPKAQELLSTYLHILGIALNYKDTHILNPHWVTKGIYSILTAKKLAKKQGELKACDLATILNPQFYPPEHHPFLFELMRKFELCFRFSENESQYLIPQLLDKQEPEAASSFAPTQCLNFQYHYPALPKGILPRFIVRTHILSKNKLRWRTGVILDFENNQALVKADIQDKKVYISVKGAPEGQRRLLAIIRSNFERIHSDFSFRPDEMVPIPQHPNVIIPYQKLLVLEQNKIPTLQEVSGDQVLDLNVSKLLNGVDLEGTRQSQSNRILRNQALNLFYSYSHKDEALRDELETHLKLLQRQSLIQPWYDRRIAGGQEWKNKIDENLEQADIILLLISADFIASDYCFDLEMKQALERHNAQSAHVIPVILRPCDWHSSPFGHLQALPKDGKPVTQWSNKDEAFLNVAQNIRSVINSRQQSSSNINPTIPKLSSPSSSTDYGVGQSPNDTLEAFFDLVQKGIHAGQSTVQVPANSVHHQIAKSLKANGILLDIQTTDQTLTLHLNPQQPSLPSSGNIKPDIAILDPNLAAIATNIENADATIRFNAIQTLAQWYEQQS